VVLVGALFVASRTVKADYQRMHAARASVDQRI
jgi:hypothetical protein